MTLLTCELLRARHPAAAATAFAATLAPKHGPSEIARIIAAVAVAALTGEVTRRTRTARMLPRRRSLPGGGSAPVDRVIAPWHDGHERERAIPQHAGAVRGPSG
jgi:hypothetical protein